jgi:hypothetical protein
MAREAGEGEEEAAACPECALRRVCPQREGSLGYSRHCEFSAVAAGRELADELCRLAAEAAGGAEGVTSQHPLLRELLLAGTAAQAADEGGEQGLEAADVPGVGDSSRPGPQWLQRSVACLAPLPTYMFNVLPKSAWLREKRWSAKVPGTCLSLAGRMQGEDSKKAVGKDEA